MLIIKDELLDVDTFVGNRDRKIASVEESKYHIIIMGGLSILAPPGYCVVSFFCEK